MPEDIFTTRAPLDVVDALTKAVSGHTDRASRAHTPWNVIVATR